ncbi:MAG TPA: DUF456 domain-containing protein [Dehalococcoidales bacterium]|nr:DUF456 domain-containing protein [Dehalococcoidales bacterium]
MIIFTTMEIAIYAVICSLLMLVGLVGVFAPILPGIPLAWLGLFIYAIGTGFERISVTTIIVFAAITALILLLDFLAPILGAKKFQASKYGVLGAFIGLIIGVIFFNIWGVIIGPFLGAFLFEFLAKRKAKGALKAAFGTFIGYVVGALVKVIFICVMAGFFIVSLF